MTDLDDIKADILAAMEYWNAIYGELDHSSDRVAAIAALAHVEALLQNALCAKFTNLDNLDKLFGPDGALMSVAARLDLAYALDILAKQTMRDIKVCARVRNLFAHSFQPVRFTDESVDQLIAKLATPKIVTKSPWGVASNRARYLTTLWHARMTIDSDTRHF